MHEIYTYIILISKLSLYRHLFASMVGLLIIDKITLNDKDVFISSGHNSGLWLRVAD
jgi:hypothetical protein